jgi:hypothetical protein
MAKVKLSSATSGGGCGIGPRRPLIHEDRRDEQK